MKNLVQKYFEAQNIFKNAEGMIDEKSRLHAMEVVFLYEMIPMIETLWKATIREHDEKEV